MTISQIREEAYDKANEIHNELFEEPGVVNADPSDIDKLLSYGRLWMLALALDPSCAFDYEPDPDKRLVRVQDAMRATLDEVLVAMYG